MPDGARWPALTNAKMDLGDALNAAGFEIEAANAPRLDNVLKPTNWSDESKLGSPANRERIIRSLLNHFSSLNLRDDSIQLGGENGVRNVLGDAHEYLIDQFADDAGKKGGEFYTPRSVVRLIVKLLEPRERMRICDPTAGSGGMLIYTAIRQGLIEADLFEALIEIVLGLPRAEIVFLRCVDEQHLAAGSSRCGSGPTTKPRRSAERRS